MGLIKCLRLRPQEPVTHTSDLEMTEIVEQNHVDRQSIPGTNEKGGTTLSINKTKRAAN